MRLGWVDGVGPVMHRWNRVEDVEEFVQPRGVERHAVDETHGLVESHDHRAGERDEGRRDVLVGLRKITEAETNSSRGAEVVR